MEGDENSAGDTISNLPDSLLADIMSLASLETKDVVQMCIFSKRWKNFWVTLHDLYFNLDDFKSRDTSRHKEKFVYFVDMVLDSRCYLHHNIDNVHKFVLSCNGLRKNHHYLSIKKWIEYAVRRRAQVLEFDVYKCKVLPQYMFTCESLRELTLYVHDWSDIKGSITPTGKVNLPHLKKLLMCCSHVGGSAMDADIFLKLLSGCPDLEYLRVESIYAPPDLKADPIPSPLKNLKDATISLQYAPNNYYMTDKIVGLTLFSSLSFVENLDLCLIMFNYPFSYPALDRLKHLSLCMHNDEYLRDLWEHLPNLEKVTMWQSCQREQLSCRQFFKDSTEWKYIMKIALDKCKKLRKIEIKSSRSDDQVWCTYGE